MIEARAQAVDPTAGDARIIIQRAGHLAGLVTHLAIEIAELRLQFLDAGMTVEQRRGLFGELRPQRRPLFRQPPDQFGIEHFGSLDRLAALEHFADQPRPVLGVRFQRAGVVQLGVDLAHLLVRQRGVVGTDEQTGLGTEVLDPRLGVRDSLAQGLDLTADGVSVASVHKKMGLRGMAEAELAFDNVRVEADDVLLPGDESSFRTLLAHLNHERCGNARTDRRVSRRAAHEGRDARGNCGRRGRHARAVAARVGGRPAR